MENFVSQESDKFFGNVKPFKIASLAHKQLSIFFFFQNMISCSSVIP